MLNSRLPISNGFHKCGAYTRVIFNCRLVNSNSSLAEQSPREAMRHAGTNLIGNAASCKTLVKVKSSEMVPLPTLN